MLPDPFLSCLTKWKKNLSKTWLYISPENSYKYQIQIIFTSHCFDHFPLMIELLKYLLILLLHHVKCFLSWSSQLGSVLRILPFYLFLPHPVKALHLDRKTGQPFHQHIPRTEAMPGMPSPIFLMESLPVSSMELIRSHLLLSLPPNN